MAQTFEHCRTATTPTSRQTITFSEALRRKHLHLQSISLLANQFGGKIVDVSENTVIMELAGKSSRVDTFLNLLKPPGALESARSGITAMPHTPISTSPETETEEGVEEVDATLLSPG